MGSIGFSMTDQKRWIANIVIAIIPAVIMFSSCNNLKLESKWRDRDISIDGLHTEWENALMFSEEKRATVGFINDDKHLYLCLMAADQHVLMQSLAAGFTVWFDEMGNKREKFGIRFPIGMKDFKPDMSRRDRGRQDQNRMSEMLQNQTELEIIQSEKIKKISLSQLDEYGISLKTGRHLGRFVYELKIPLRCSDTVQYAIVPEDDGTIKVGFELGKMELPDMERRPPGDGREFPGGMRPGGRGMRGPRGGNRPERPEEFKFWISVKLANSQLNGPG